MKNQKLKIQDYALWIHLGVSEHEQFKKQRVHLSIEIEYLEDLKSCLNDSIEDMTCYDSLTQGIENFLKDKKIRTIEHLSKIIYDFSKSKILQKNKLNIHIHKVHPPMPNILGGTHFTYGDS
jgi:FolB domain-containing protein